MYHTVVGPRNWDTLCFVSFLSLNLLIGWQLSICIGCKPFVSLLYSCQVPCFWRLALSIVVGVFPRPFFANTAPSRMFSTNSLCLIVCPIPEWCLFFKVFKSNLSYFALCKFSSFVVLSVILLLTFFFSTLFQMHLWSSLHFS